MGGGHRHKPSADRFRSDHGGKSLRQKRALEKAAAKAVKQAAKKAVKENADKLKKTNKAPDRSGKTTPTKSQTLKAAAARASRTAVKASRPHAARARKAAARQTRRAGGALWDGMCALTAGAWTLLRRGRHAALDRLKAVWKRRRKNRNQPDTPADQTPVVADTVRRPTTPAPTSLSGGTMSGGGHHFVAPAMEAARAAAHYQPTGMLQVGADFAGLEEGLRLHAEAMKVTVENADANFPLDPNIVEIMRQIHSLQLKAADLASELQPAFRNLHDVDISRLENPRKGAHAERMWDVSTNL
ncbi:hypothetical protein ACWEG1_06010 [Streptomyces bauhiniae]